VVAPEPIQPKPISSGDFVQTMKERLNVSNRNATPEPAAVFDETDLDIPAFIRDHRNRV